MKTIRRFALVVVGLAAVALQAAAPDKLSGFSETIRVGNALYEALEEKYQKGISPRPIALETEPVPYVRSDSFVFNGRPLGVVVVSTGFIDLMRRVAKARAYDAVEPGYFDRYLALLSATDPAKGVPTLPDESNKKFADPDLLNNQRTYFAQMVSMVVAIELSHQYLGQNTKYASKTAGELPIKSVMSRSDWQKSVEAAVENSLSAGYGPESVCAFYEALERMSQKPAWTAYFLPADEKVNKLTSKLAKLEKKFFNLD